MGGREGRGHVRGKEGGHVSRGRGTCEWEGGRGGDM